MMIQIRVWDWNIGRLEFTNRKFAFGIRIGEDSVLELEIGFLGM